MAEDEKSMKKELCKKDRFEILLERIECKVDAISEGHGILLAEVKEGNKKSEKRDKELEDMIKSNSYVLHKKIDDVKTELSQRHR